MPRDNPVRVYTDTVEETVAHLKIRYRDDPSLAVAAASSAAEYWELMYRVEGGMDGTRGPEYAIRAAYWVAVRNTLKEDNQ